MQGVGPQLSGAVVCYTVWTAPLSHPLRFLPLFPHSSPLLGAFVLLGYLGSVIDQWCSRLVLDQDTVSRLVATQPALLEMSPNTVKARLVSVRKRGGGAEGRRSRRCWRCHPTHSRRGW